MCNCGNKRNEISNEAAQPETLDKSLYPDYNFEYTGKTALTVTGNVTGKRYRFNAPGERMAIDYRDASAVAAVPVLKRV